MDDFIERFSNVSGDLSKPLILELQVNGVRNTYSNPNIPMEAEDITREILGGIEHGASIIHSHNSDPLLSGEDAYEDYMASLAPVLRAYPELLWNPTISLSTDPRQSGMEHIELLVKRAGLRLCCVDSGATNLCYGKAKDGGLQSAAYYWSLDQISAQVKRCKELNCGIIFGIYEPGYLRTAAYFINNGLAPSRAEIDLYLMGPYGLVCVDPLSTIGLPVEMESLYYYLHLMESFGLRDQPWFVTIWGAGHADLRPIMRRVMELGGHLKIGLESHFDPDHKPTNIELLEEAKGLARELGRPVATRAQAAGILGLA